MPFSYRLVNLLITIALLSFGCAAPKSEDNETSATSDSRLIPHHDPPPTAKDTTEAISETPIQEIMNYVYVGELGFYSSQVVMHLKVDVDVVSGTYYYTKHQKLLQLKGQRNEDTGEMEMTESHNGEVTGYFNFTFYDSTIAGSWRPTADATTKSDFTLRWMTTVSDSFVNQQDERFKGYIHEYESALYNSETQKWNSMSATNSIKIGQIDTSLFDFKYDITGMNGHSGSLSGVGTMTDDTSGYYTDGDGCELRFVFLGDSINIKSEGCQDYAGMRAHFGGTLFLEE